MDITPKKIYDDLNKKLITKSSAMELLIDIIYNSDNNTIRVECVHLLGEIGEKSNKIFKIAENLLVSDSNERVRDAAAKIINEGYIEKALKPMSWGLEHELSPKILLTIYNTLIKIIKTFENEKTLESKDILINEIKKIKEKDFKLGFDIISEKTDINTLEVNVISDILRNYYTWSYLSKTFWRLKYHIENCRILELNFLFKSLTSVPDVIKNLSSLKRLVLRYNQLKTLPKWISVLKELEVLNVNSNNLKKIPNEIGELESLKELALWINELKTLPDTIGHLNELKELNLGTNKLEQLPDSLGDLKNLIFLNLHGNELNTIPQTICNLTSLEYLNLSWNLLTSIPENIDYLRSLKYLNLEKNELIEIPEAIGNLKNLEYLNISRNELKELPESLISLSSLKELYLGDNKFIKQPKIVQELEEKGIHVYYISY